MDPGADPIVRFGVFEANLQTGELRKAGLRIKIQDQPMLVLAALVERAGELVTREELQQRLWPGVAHLDFEHGLNMAVRKLRAALNDSAETPRYIETLARKGYRFVGPVEFKAPPATSGGATVSVPDHLGDSQNRLGIRWKIPAMYTLAGLTAILVTAAFFYGRPSHVPIKVIPFASSSGTIRALSFSPDGTALAYELVEENAPSKIFLKGLDSNPARRLTDDEDASHREYSPAWIPDGSGVSFLRTATDSEAALFSVPVNGGTPRKLIDLGACRGYSWEPHAKAFAVSLVDPDGIGTLSKVTLPGGHRQQLAAPAKFLSNTVILLGGDSFPKFSPGRKMDRLCP